MSARRRSEPRNPDFHPARTKPPNPNRHKKTWKQRDRDIARVIKPTKRDKAAEKAADKASDAALRAALKKQKIPAAAITQIVKQTKATRDASRKKQAKREEKAASRPPEDSGYNIEDDARQSHEFWRRIYDDVGIILLHSDGSYTVFRSRRTAMLFLTDAGYSDAREAMGESSLAVVRYDDRGGIEDVLWERNISDYED